MLAGETKFKGESFGCNAWVMPFCFVASDDMGSVNAINMEVVYATNAGASRNCLPLHAEQHSTIGRIWYRSERLMDWWLIIKRLIIKTSCYEKK